MDEREHLNDDEDEFADGLDAEAVVEYIVEEIARALGAHEAAASGSVQRVLPLGEMLALFNLADQFGLIDRVRADLDQRLGRNAYLAFSEAMKTALLDRGFGPGGGPRPATPPRSDAPRPNRPPDRDRGDYPRRPNPTDRRPPRGGRPPGRSGR